MMRGPLQSAVAAAGTAIVAALALGACWSTTGDTAPGHVPDAGADAARGSGGGPGAGGRAASSDGGRAPTTGGVASTGTGGASGGAAGGASGASGGAGPLAVDCRADGDGKTTLVFVNRCAASVTFAGSDIAGDTLAPGAFACVDVGTATETLSAKRYWGYTGADPGNEHYTLAEFTFNTTFNDFDWYDISHVDAFNLPMQIQPVERPKCKTLTCSEDLLPGCPAVGQFRTNGELVSCVSPDRNDGNSPVALYFESCDDAYAWSGDDQNGTDPSPVRACAGEDFDITFCPPAG